MAMKLRDSNKHEMTAALGVGKFIYVGKRRRVGGRLVNGFEWDSTSAVGAQQILFERGEEWKIELFDETPPGACPNLPLCSKPEPNSVLWLATSRLRRMTAIAFHGPGSESQFTLAEKAVLDATIAPSASSVRKPTRI